jgi:hypothetical protein
MLSAEPARSANSQGMVCRAPSPFFIYTQRVRLGHLEALSADANYPGSVSFAYSHIILGLEGRDQTGHEPTMGNRRGPSAYCLSSALSRGSKTCQVRLRQAHPQFRLLMRKM